MPCIWINRTVGVRIQLIRILLEPTVVAYIAYTIQIDIVLIEVSIIRAIIGCVSDTVSVCVWWIGTNVGVTLI